ncbi:hypothetical protein EW026_g4107 [Hermanssonia centrifuga]|uniref:DUF6533 domain-containing protein n=1 Tax=Hermanssonia centrifuga TaxID=98765 RepID=A0A4S4KI55_9APHY|nr:hypothetical protein EW026_g4107 [Hermanssonia centrifuga]
MSQADSAEVIAEFQTEFILTLITYAMTALVVYEYIITVQQEVMMVWLRKWTLATWLFMINRYLMIAVVIWQVSPVTAQR